MAEQRWAQLVDAPFDGGYPTAAAADEPRDQIPFKRGVPLYDWAMPAVALEALAPGRPGHLRRRFNNADELAPHRTGNPCRDVEPGRQLRLRIARSPDERGDRHRRRPPHLQGLVDDAW